ncbi:hypothetical protein ES703_97724 [subsurface metagenome]
MVFVETVGWRATAPADDYVRIFVTPMRGGVAVSDTLPLCSPTWDINGRYQFINQDVDSIKLQVEDLMTGELIAYVNGTPVHTFGPCPASTLTWMWRPTAAPAVAAWPTIERKYLLIGGGIAAAVAVAAVALR